MLKAISAVYENGVLRPLDPLSLEEHQKVRVIVSDEPPHPADDWLDYGYMASIDAMEEPVPTIEEVHRALSNIPGNLSDDIRAERDSRG